MTMIYTSKDIDIMCRYISFYIYMIDNSPDNTWLKYVISVYAGIN